MNYFVLTYTQFEQYTLITKPSVINSNVAFTMFIVPQVANFENYTQLIDEQTRNRYILTSNWND
jgi:hypothetical protein